MSDREEIPALLIRYATGTDRRDRSPFQRMFTGELIRGDDGWRIACRRFTQVRVAPVGQPS